MRGCAVFIRIWGGCPHYHVKVRQEDVPGSSGRTVSAKFDNYFRAETFARRVMRWVFPGHRVLSQEESGEPKTVPSGRRWFYRHEGD